MAIFKSASFAVIRKTWIFLQQTRRKCSTPGTEQKVTLLVTARSNKIEISKGTIESLVKCQRAIKWRKYFILKKPRKMFKIILAGSFEVNQKYFATRKLFIQKGSRVHFSRSGRTFQTFMTTPQIYMATLFYKNRTDIITIFEKRWTPILCEKSFAGSVAKLSIKRQI